MADAELRSLVERTGGNLFPEEGSPTTIYYRHEVADEDLLFLRSTPYPMIEEISLGYSSVSDQAITHLVGQPQLRRLRLTSTHVTGAFLSDIRLPQLELLRLDRCPNLEVRELVKGLCRFPTLTELDVKMTCVDDSCAEVISRIGGLKNLNAERTKITDEGLGYLSRLVNLEYLHLNHTETSHAGRVKLLDSLPKVRRGQIIL